jgi:hypothetical protein
MVRDRTLIRHADLVDLLIPDPHRIVRVHKFKAAYGDASGYTPPDTPITPSGDKIWVTLHWQAAGPTAQNLSASLRLTDPGGKTVAQVDKPLLNRWHLESSGWQAGENNFDYYLLTTPRGTVPDHYKLTVTVYNTADGLPIPAIVNEMLIGTPTLGAVEVMPTISLPDFATTDDIGLLWDEGIRLLDSDSLPQGSLIPGDSFHMALTWQPEMAVSRDVSLQVCLEGQGVSRPILDNAPLGSYTFPTSRWRRAEVVRQWLKIQLPRLLPGGNYKLTLCSDDNDHNLSLGTIQIQGRSRLFQLPADLDYRLDVTFGEQIRLAGSQLARSDDGNLELTLYWQALDDIPESYKVFVHLLNEAGQIVAQSDQIPAGGSAPTTSWLPGEIVADQYRFTLPEGVYHLAIGLYDPLDGQRLATPDAPDGRLILSNLRF